MTAANNDKLSLGTCVGYGVGQVGGQVLRDTPALILPIYMATMLGMEPALASLVILIAKAWAVVADPLAGIVSDRSNTRWGRRRPFILVGGLLGAVTFLLLFLPPAAESQFALFAYMTAIYVLLNTGFSLFSVPYLTMASEMSEDPDERTKLLSFRNAALAIGLIVAGALSNQIIDYVIRVRGGTPAEGYVWMGIALAVIIAFTTIWVFAGTAKAPATAPTASTLSLGEQVRIAWSNKPFVTLITANIVQYISAGIGYAGGFFFLAYAVGLGADVFRIVPVWIILIAGTSILAMPLLVWASVKFGKMRLYKASLLAFAVSTPLYFFAAPDRLWIVWLVAILIGLFNGGFILMSYSVLTDTINHDRKISGVSREGALSAIYSAVDKVGNAVGAAIFMAFLSTIDFVESSDGSFAEQSPETLSGIAMFYILGPALLHAGSILILNRYRLEEAEPER